MVAEDRLALLLTRPLGVKTVTNPAPATGAADPEALDEARRNAPRTVLTLDRVVSLTDYEDFARSFAGIGKAQARLLWLAGERRVHLTVAALDGGAIPADSELLGKLREALERHRDRQQPLTLASVAVVRFFTGLKVKLHPDHRQEEVFARVEAELRQRFSPAARDFGQGVSASELAAAVQGVAGVVAVDIDRLDLGLPLLVLPFLRTVGGRALLSQVKARLFAQPARLGPRGQMLPAQILALSPSPISLGPMP
jgi:predicted phage baseplate assembly protein